METPFGILTPGLWMVSAKSKKVSIHSAFIRQQGDHQRSSERPLMAHSGRVLCVAATEEALEGVFPQAGQATGAPMDFHATGEMLMISCRQRPFVERGRRRQLAPEAWRPR